MCNKKMCLFLREILTQYWSPTPTKHKGLCRAKATTAAGVTGGAFLFTVL